MNSGQQQQNTKCQHNNTIEQGAVCNSKSWLKDLTFEADIRWGSKIHMVICRKCVNRRPGGSPANLGNGHLMPKYPRSTHSSRAEGHRTAGCRYGTTSRYATKIPRTINREWAGYTGISLCRKSDHLPIRQRMRPQILTKLGQQVANVGLMAGGDLSHCRQEAGTNQRSRLSAQNPADRGMVFQKPC